MVCKNCGHESSFHSLKCGCSFINSLEAPFFCECARFSGKRKISEWFDYYLEWFVGDDEASSLKVRYQRLIKKTDLNRKEIDKRIGALVHDYCVKWHIITESK